MDRKLCPVPRRCLEKGTVRAGLIGPYPKRSYVTTSGAKYLIVQDIRESVLPALIEDVRTLLTSSRLPTVVCTHIVDKNARFLYKLNYFSTSLYLNKAAGPDRPSCSPPVVKVPDCTCDHSEPDATAAAARQDAIERLQSEVIYFSLIRSLYMIG